MRGKSNFACLFKLIWVVQSLAQKYCYFVLPEIGVHFARSASARGAYRDRHETWRGMRWTWAVPVDERH